MAFGVRFIYFIGLSLNRCLADADLALPHDPRRNELTLPRKPSWPSSDSDEKPAIFMRNEWRMIHNFSNKSNKEQIKNSNEINLKFMHQRYLNNK